MCFIQIRVWCRCFALQNTSSLLFEFILGWLVLTTVCMWAQGMTRIQTIMLTLLVQVLWNVKSSIKIIKGSIESIHVYRTITARVRLWEQRQMSRLRNKKSTTTATTAQKKIKYEQQRRSTNEKHRIQIWKYSQTKIYNSFYEGGTICGRKRYRIC